MNLSVRSWSDASFPIDLDHLEYQAPELRGTTHHLAHFFRRALEDGLDPTPFFSTEWYAWQNPDWCEGFDTPYRHYLDRGRFEGRDPSPFVDVTRYMEATGGAVPRQRVYHAVLSGLRSPALGVYDGLDDLEACQRRFFDGIAMVAHRMTPAGCPKPSLVVCQAGRGARMSWARETGREFDVLLNYYDAAGAVPCLGDYVVFQKGTKFTAMALLSRRFPELLRSYQHILFLDDDIDTSTRDLNALFRACRAHRLDLAQMTLTKQSSCNWDQLFSQPGRTGPRPVSAVEIMMPVISRRAFRWIRPTLGQSVSGFGLDLVWGKIVREHGGRIAVLDDVRATHARPVDQTGGAYYGYLRQNGINAKAELWVLLKRYAAERDLLTT